MANNSLFVDKIKAGAKHGHGDIVDIRRHLHRNPELSYQEEQTGRFISGKLTEWQIPFSSGWCKHGVVAMIEGGKPGPVVALRADIDALPIFEKNEIAYKSLNEGVMHACGHDVHTSSLLGAVKILSGLKEEIAGTIKCIFQPAEEKLPGGASVLIKEGVLRDPSPYSIVGQHVHPPLEVGKVGFRSGTYMASADELFFRVIGKGGHGALPNDCIDPILIASHIVIGLQQVISRRSDPLVPCVLSIGKINSVGGATNIIPNEVKMQGTFRTFDEKWRKEAHIVIRDIASGVARSMGAECEVDIIVGYPSLYNDEAITIQCIDAAKSYLGEENVVELPMRSTAEDFAYYSREIPACFYRLGTGNPEKGITSPVHTDTFDIDEDALLVGAGLMAYLAVSLLNK